MANEDDEIQGHRHARGIFYESDVLGYVKTLCPRDQVIVDAGANVGNHAVFFDKVCGAHRVYVFEPNPPAQEVLFVNSALNDCQAVDTTFVEYAVADEPGVFAPGVMNPYNWGGTRMAPKADGTIAGVRLDDALAGAEVGLIKLDIEGMEPVALRGVAGLIQRCKPTLVIEATPETAPEIRALLEGFDYRVERTFSMYGAIVTVVALPRAILASP